MISEHHHAAWSQVRSRSRVFERDTIYHGHSRGVACYSAADGKPIWQTAVDTTTAGRYGDDATSTALDNATTSGDGCPLAVRPSVIAPLRTPARRSAR